MRNFITIFIYIILLPTFEYFRHSLQYIDILTIQIRHTTNEGRKPIPNISALIARITASTLHILFVILNALNAHFPTIIFSASSQVSSPPANSLNIYILLLDILNLPDIIFNLKRIKHFMKYLILLN